MVGAGHDPPLRVYMQMYIQDLGLIDYQTAYAFQKATVQKVIEGGQATLILCEHAPVFTLGRIATEENFLVQRATLEAQGATVCRINRGGEVTFHGPGQLIAYPILNLNYFSKDLKLYMGKLEQVAVDLLQYFGIVAHRFSGRTGVFCGGRKIATIGIGVRRWVSFHGMAVNVSTDLGFFSMIKPCGLDVQMTSMSKELGRSVELKEVKEKFIEYFCLNFNLELHLRGVV